MRPWADVALSHVSCVVLDCETTGLDPVTDGLVSIACVRIIDGVIDGSQFETLVDPERPIPAEVSTLHGIHDEMVAGAPTATAAARGVAEFVGGQLLAGQLLAFDLAFLRAGGFDSQRATLDTLLMSQVLWPETGVRHNLSAICERLGVAEIGRHTAQGDALMTAQCLLAMAPMFEERGIRSVGELARACESTRRARDISRRYQ